MNAFINYFMRGFAAISLAILAYATSVGVVLAGDDTSQLKPLVMTVPESDGVLIEYASAIYKELGIRVGRSFEVVSLPKKRTLVFANEGKYDGVVFRTKGIDKDYPQLHMVNVPVLFVKHILFAVRPNVIKSVNDYPSLTRYFSENSYTVGYLRGSKKARDSLSGLADENKYPLSSPQQGFGMLAEGRLDAYLGGPGMVNRRLLSREFDNKGIQEVGVFAEFPLYPYLHNQHVSLLPEIASEFQRMLDEGVLEKIRSGLE